MRIYFNRDACILTRLSLISDIFLRKMLIHRCTKTSKTNEIKVHSIGVFKALQIVCTDGNCEKLHSTRLNRMCNFLSRIARCLTKRMWNFLCGIAHTARWNRMWNFLYGIALVWLNRTWNFLCGITRCSN